jgi:hypothetical protein
VLAQPNTTVNLHPLPLDVTAVMASAVGTAGGGITLHLPSAAGVLVYLSHLTITCPNVAAVVAGLVTLTGISTQLNWQYVETVSAGAWLDHHFNPPVPASAPNTDIVLTVPPIAGGGVVAVNMFGYQG